MKLLNKIALITGGNSGIGYAIAEQFKIAGAKGMIIGRNLNSLSAAQSKLSPDFKAYQCDVTKADEVEKFYLTLANNFGTIDILVLNAGGAIDPKYMSVGSFERMDETSFNKIVDLNFKSVFFNIQMALPYLNNGASIILISSIAHRKGFENLSVYSACKAAVRSLAKTLSAELLPERGIRVNVISPGTIDTPAMSRMGIPENHLKRIMDWYTSLIPLKRIGKPEEIGTVAVFLASSDSSFIVGEDIIVDGGVVNVTPQKEYTPLNQRNKIIY